MLSIVILTFNSQKYLLQVLESAKFADEIIIVDSGSTDDTIQIAKKFQNVVVLHQDWLGFADQKQHGVNAAKNSWIFVLDSDEIITDELRDEILQTIKGAKFKAYKVARLNYFFGKSIKSMGLYPDFSVRLFDRRFAKFDGRSIHEKVILNDKDDKLGELKNHFIHYAYDNVEQFIQKQNRYSTLGAKQSKFKAFFSPFWTFFRLFVLKNGWHDGWRGYVIAKLYAQYTFWKYIK